MIRTSVLALAVVLGSWTPDLELWTVEDATTWTGWFSDKGCATARINAGQIAPNGTECVKKCLNDGATPVFISEQAKALYDVRDYAAVIDDVGYHVEVTGIVDEKAKTIAIRSVKRLSEVVQMCARPKKDKGL